MIQSVTAIITVIVTMLFISLNLYSRNQNNNHVIKMKE